MPRHIKASPERALAAWEASALQATAPPWPRSARSIKGPQRRWPLKAKLKAKIEGKLTSGAADKGKRAPNKQN